MALRSVSGKAAVRTSPASRHLLPPLGLDLFTRQSPPVFPLFSTVRFAS